MIEHRLIWDFRPAPDREAEFLAAYGAEGAWVRLFRRGEGYLGTRLEPVAGRPGTWRTVDRWASPQDWRAFRQRYSREYAALDAECEALTEFEQAVEIAA
ncbi:MAG: hypothetical protein Q8Q73_05330 [Stagnimonas sp.]|nr:hypothetical protein [Stagnimonas sp.]